MPADATSPNGGGNRARKCERPRRGPKKRSKEIDGADLWRELRPRHDPFGIPVSSGFHPNSAGFLVPLGPSFILLRSLFHRRDFPFARDRHLNVSCFREREREIVGKMLAPIEFVSLTLNTEVFLLRNVRVVAERVQA